MSSAFATAVTFDATYQLVVGPTAATFRWRRFPQGVVPVGQFSDPVPITTAATVLELGVTVTFATTVKSVGDAWTFDALL